MPVEVGVCDTFKPVSKRALFCEICGYDKMAHPVGVDIEQVFAGMVERIAILRTFPLEGGQLADAAGMCRRLERDLQSLRAGWNEQLRDSEPVAAAEPQAPTQWDSDHAQAVGTQFQTKKRRSAKRSYSTAAIIHGVSHETGTTPMQQLNAMVMSGVATINWKYLKLKGYLEALDIDLAEHTLDDEEVPDDGSISDMWMGEKWKTTMEQQAIRQEGADDEQTN
jgi:hypothetical protein